MLGLFLGFSLAFICHRFLAAAVVVVVVVVVAVVVIVVDGLELFFTAS